MAQQTPTAPTTLTDDQVLELMNSGKGTVGKDVGGPPIAMSDEEVAAILANKEGVLNPGQGGGAPAPTPGFMDSPLPGITSAIGLTPRHITRAATGFKDAIVGTAKSLYDVGTDPINLLGPGASVTKNMLIEPAKQMFDKAGEAVQSGRTSEAMGYATAGALPGIGPMAAHVGEQIGAGNVPELIGELAGVYVTGKAMSGAPGAVNKVGSKIGQVQDFRTGSGVFESGMGGAKLSPVPVRANISNLAAISRATNIDIVEAQQFLKEAAQIHKLDPNLIAVTERAPKTQLIGDLEYGLPKPQYDAFIRSLGKDPARASSVPIELASEAVRLSNRPFELAIDTYGRLPTPRSQINVEGQLRSLAETAVDDGVKRAYLMLADKVKKEGGDFKGLNGVKVWANKETTRFHNLTPGGQINAAATPVIAFADTARMISKELYPEVEMLSKGKLNLREAGRKEAQAINFRDGLYKEWNNAATAHAIEVAAQQNKSWREWAGEKLTGMNPITKTPIGLTTQAVGNVARGAGKRLPLEQFNTLFKNGVGGVEGWVPGTKLPVELLTEPLPGQANVGKFLPPGPGPVQGPLQPPPVAVAGQPTVGQGAQIRGVDARVAGQLPMQPSRLDFGSGRVPTTTNQQFSGTATTPPLMKPSGPGTLLTRDPRVLKSTLDAIDKTLQTKVLNDAHRAELMTARAKILAQLQPPSPLAPPPTQ